MEFVLSVLGALLVIIIGIGTLLWWLIESTNDIFDSWEDDDIDIPVL